MGLSVEEKNKLQIFHNLQLTRNQIETILGRKISNAEWKSIDPNYYDKIFKPIAVQAAKKATKRGYLRSTKKSTEYAIKDIFKKVAIQAAKVAKRKQKKKSEEPEDNFHFIKSLYK